MLSQATTSTSPHMVSIVLQWCWHGLAAGDGHLNATMVSRLRDTPLPPLEQQAEGPDKDIVGDSRRAGDF